MTRNADETALHALIETWARAVRDKDMDGILANHAEDIVMFDVPVPLQSKGMAAYRETWELFFRYSPGGPGSFDPMELRVVASETVAYCHGLVRIFDARVRLTMGMRKENGRWLIAHEHHSCPIALEEDGADAAS